MKADSSPAGRGGNGAENDAERYCRKYMKIIWLVTAAAFIITAVVVQFMPDSVPMHYNAAGEIDRYGSKYENFIFPVMIAGLNLFWYFFIRYYRNKSRNAGQAKDREEARNNVKVIGLSAVGEAVMFTIMQCFILYLGIANGGNAKNPGFGIDVVTNICLAVLIIVLGNALPKTKRNSFIGMRSVWSMDNDRTWAASNRFAGKVFIVCGVLIMFETLLIKGLASTFVMLGILLGAAVICLVQSYQAYKKYGNHVKDNS